MALVKYRDYEIEQAHLDGRSFSPTCPIIWLRDRFKAGDKIGLFIDSDNQDILILKKVEPNGSAKSVGESIPEKPSVGQG